MRAAPQTHTKAAHTDSWVVDAKSRNILETHLRHLLHTEFKLAVMGQLLRTLAAGLLIKVRDDRHLTQAQKEHLLAKASALLEKAHTLKGVLKNVKHAIHLLEAEMTSTIHEKKATHKGSAKHKA